MNVTAAARTVDYELLPHQFQALTSQKRIIGALWGVGAGKTNMAGSFLANKVYQAPPDMIGLAAANTYTQIKDATMRRAYLVWRQLGLRVDPPTLPKIYGPTSVRVHNGRHWVEILCRSVDNFESLAGVELGFWVLDEAWSAVKAAYDMLVGRLRDERGGFNRQGLVVSWKDDPSHWMYSEFEENYDPKVHERVYARTDDNWFLPADYIEGLRRTYSAQLFKRLVENEWVSLAGGRIYHAFQRSDSTERAGNVSELAEFDPALPILWTHDFNIGQGKPMSSALCQVKRGPHGPTLDQFDELILESTDTNDAIEEFRQRYPGLGARIFGDASGRAKDTRSRTTDYELLRAAGFADQRVPRANPPIRDRHNAVNALLCNAAGQVRYRIHPRCKVTIKGMETVKLRSGAQYLEEETYEQHVTTAVGYLIHQEFPVVERRVESGNLALFRRR